MANRLGVKPQTVNKWAHGQTTPSPEHWPEIERYLGMPEGGIGQVAGIARASADLDRLTAALTAAVDGLDGDPLDGADVDARLNRMEEALTEIRGIVDRLASAVPEPDP